MKNQNVIGNVAVPSVRQIRRSVLAMAVAAAAAGLFARSANATLYWDPGHTGATGSGGTGTWDTATANWTAGSGDTTWDGSAAVFNGVGNSVYAANAVNSAGVGSISHYNVSVPGAISTGAMTFNTLAGNLLPALNTSSPTAPDQLYFNTANYDLTGVSGNYTTQTITLTGSSPTITVNGNGYAEIGTSQQTTTAVPNVTLAGSNGFTLNGTGSLVLADTLQLTGGITVNPGATLVFGDNVDGFYTNVNPTPFLNNNPVTLNSGTLLLATSLSPYNGGVPIGIGTVTVSGSSTIELSRIESSASSSVSYNGLVMNAGTSAMSTAVELTGTPIANVNSTPILQFTSTSIVNSGPAIFQAYENAAGTTGDRMLLGTFGDSSTTGGPGNAVTFISGGSSTIPGGTFQVSSTTAGATSATGSWTVGAANGTQAARLDVYTASSGNGLAGITTGNITVNNNSQLQIDGVGNLLWGVPGQTVTINGPGLGTAATASGLAYTATPGALYFYSTTTSNNGIANEVLFNVAMPAASSITVAAGTTSQIDGTVTGVGPLVFGSSSLTGNLVLNGSTNNWTGGTVINGGTINVAAGSTFTTTVGPLTFASLGTTPSSTGLTLNNAAQTVGSLSSSFVATSGTASNTITLNGAALNIVQTTSGKFGPGIIPLLTSTITDGSSPGSVSLDSRSTATLTLSGPNTYSGGTTINGGTLIVTNTTGSATGPGQVVVNSTGALGGSGIIAGNVSLVGGTLTPGTTAGTSHLPGTLTTGSLSLTNGTLNFSLNTVHSSDTIVDTGSLSLAGTTDINLANLGALNTGIYPLITYGGSLSGSVASNLALMPYTSLPSGFSYTILNDPGEVDLKVVSNTNPIYWAVGNGNWDTTSANWTGASTTFAHGSAVVFDDTASGASPITVTLTSNVAPGFVTFNNSSKAYTLSGPGSITGNTSFVVTGGGTVTVANGGTTGNTFTGVVAVDGGGTLAVSADNEAGAAVNTIALTSSNASNLSSFQANASFASGRTVTLYQVGGAIDVTSGNTLTLNGPIAGAGGLYKTDAGTLVLANASAGNAYVGPTTVVAGTLALTATNTLPITTPVTVDSGATLNVSANTQVGSFAGSGAITIASGKALTVGFNTGGSTFGGTITGAGSLVFAGPGSLGLTGGGNTFSGGLTISNAGTFAVGASAGTGQITLSGASTLQLTNPTFTFGPGTGQTPATSLSLNVSTGGGILSAASGSNITLPALYGSGTLTVTGGTTITSAGYLNSSGGVIAGTSTGTIKLGTSSGDAADTLVLTQVAVLTGEPGTGTAGINLTSEGSTFWQNNITDGYDSNYVPVTNTTTHVTSANFAPYIGGTGSGTLTMNDGTIWKVTGKSTYGAGSPTIVDGATVTINVPASTDQLICGTAVRQTAPAVGGDPGTTSNQINVTGNGLVQFGSGAVTTQAFNGTWNLFGPGQTGTLLLENVPGGGGETLDALGYTLTNGTGEGVQSPVILNGGTIAFGADQPNPAGAVVLPVNSFRSPMSLYGGSIASSGYEYNLSATVTYGGAVFDTTPVKANIDGDITLESNSTVTVLTYDPQNPTAGSRSVNFETSGNGVTPNYGVAGNFTWDNNSTLVISPGSTTGGAVNFGRVGGTVAVRGSATLQINAGSTANIGFVPGVTGVLGTNGAVNGPVSGIDPLTDSNNPGQSVSVIDNGAIVWGGRTSLPGDAGQGIKTYGTGALTIGPGATATLNQADTHTDRTLLVVAGALTVSGTGSTLGTININNNDMIIRNGNLSAVTSLVATGYSNGNWTGNGITSAVAAANSTHLTAIGVIQNDNGTGTGTPLYPTFDGYTSSDGDVLVKYTYYGDTNLDGVVDGSDYSNIDYAYAYNKTAAPGAQLTGWANGDFNYDGVIDGSDYALIDNTFNNQGASLTSSAQVASATAQVAGVAPTAVPEPAGLSLIAAGIATIGLRRRRSVG